MKFNKISRLYIQNTVTVIVLVLYTHAKQLGIKSARPIRSSPTYVEPKALISAETKKSPIKDVLNYLNNKQ